MEEGSCGDDCHYILYYSGLLDITGTGTSGAGKIKSDAFIRWKTFDTVIVHEGITEIGVEAFCESNVVTVVLPESVTSIGQWAFARCELLKTINLPSSLTTISNSLFYCCYELESIVIPPSVQSIETRPFDGCKNLESVEYLGMKPPEFGAYGLGNCEKLNEVAVLECYKSSVFGNMNVSKSIPCDLCGSKVAYIFDENRGMLTITGDNGGMYDFSNSKPAPWSSYRTSIRLTVICAGVNSIGSNSFDGCTKLTSIEIPNSVTSIGTSAFSGCTSLTSLKIPSSVTYIGEGAFYLFYLQLNEYDNGYYLGNDENQYFALVGGKSSYVTSWEIHENTRVIAKNAFHCSSLTSITIPDSITSIPDCLPTITLSVIPAKIPFSNTPGIVFNSISNS